MNKLNKLYNLSKNVDSLELEDYSLDRKKAYEKYKTEYISKCKERKRTEYSFWQRNYKIIVVLLIIFFLLGTSTFLNERKSLESTREQVSDSLNLEESNSIGIEKNQGEGELTGEDIGKNKDEKVDELFENLTNEGNSDLNKDEFGMLIIEVGTEVIFTGNVHYKSSYANALPVNCIGGKAIVTQTNMGQAHPYHIESCEEGCTVYGWVDIKDIILSE